MLKVIRSLPILSVRSTGYLPSIGIALIARCPLEPQMLGSTAWLVFEDEHGPLDQG